MRRTITTVLLIQASLALGGTNTYVDLPTNDTTFLASAAYVSNALAFARKEYAEEMSHTNEFPWPPSANLLIGDDVLPDDSNRVHVVFQRIVGYAAAAESGTNPVPLETIAVVMEKNGTIARHEKDRFPAYVSWLRFTKENSYLELPTNRHSYLSAETYISNALTCAREHYVDLIGRPTNNLCARPYPTIRMADLDDPSAPVHVVFDRPAAPNDDFISTEQVHVVLDREGRILRHEKWPFTLTEEDKDKEDPEQSPAGDSLKAAPEE